MPTDGAATLSASASSAASSLPGTLAGFVGPIIPGVFEVDQLSVVVLICLAILATLLILLAPATGTFLRHFVMLLFFFVGAFGVVTASEIIAFFVLWEITSLFTWGIAQLEGDSQTIEEGVLPFQAAGALGSFAMFLGLALLAADRHSLSLGPLVPGGLAASHLWPVSALILLGLFFQTYGLLAEAWSVRPSNRFSLAGATLAGAGVLTLGLYPFLRFFGPVLGGLSDWQATVFWGGAVCAIVGGLAALGEVDYRRALSYGLLGELGFLAALVASGIPGVLSVVVSVAITNAFAFTGLFICLSAAEEASERVSLREVGGLARRMPLTAFLFLLCLGVVVGLPPFGSFVADRAIGLAVVSSPRLLALAVSFGLLILAYLIKLFVSLFLGAPQRAIRSERAWSIAMASGGVAATLVIGAALVPTVLALLGGGPSLGG